MSAPRGQVGIASRFPALVLGHLHTLCVSNRAPYSAIDGLDEALVEDAPSTVRWLVEHEHTEYMADVMTLAFGSRLPEGIAEQLSTAVRGLDVN